MTPNSTRRGEVKMKIKNTEDDVIYESEKTTMKEAVEEAVDMGINLWKADLRGADLWGANLREADLREANLREANLWEADLRGANLREADLREADLREANLREADLREANLREANLWEANLWGAKISQPQAADIVQALGITISDSTRRTEMTPNEMLKDMQKAVEQYGSHSHQATQLMVELLCSRLRMTGFTAAVDYFEANKK